LFDIMTFMTPTYFPWTLHDVARGAQRETLDAGRGTG
jgi:hypothetical protein